MVLGRNSRATSLHEETRGTGGDRHEPIHPQRTVSQEIRGAQRVLSPSPLHTSPPPPHHHRLTEEGAALPNQGRIHLQACPAHNPLYIRIKVGRISKASAHPGAAGWNPICSLAEFRAYARHCHLALLTVERTSPFCGFWGWNSGRQGW